MSATNMLWPAVLMVWLGASPPATTGGASAETPVGADLRNPFAIDLARTRKERVAQPRRCEHLELFYVSGERFAEGVMCEPVSGNRHRTFWHPVEQTFWHRNGNKLRETVGGVTRLWTETGQLVGEERRGSWMAGSMFGGAQACRGHEHVVIQGPSLHFPDGKFARVLGRPFELSCEWRTVRKLWWSGEPLFDGARFRYPNGRVAIEGAIGATHDGSPKRCFLPSGVEVKCEALAWSRWGAIDMRLERLPRPDAAEQ